MSRDSQVAQSIGMDCTQMVTAAKKKEPLYSKMGRPKKGVLSTYPLELRQLIKQIRKRYDRFGAKSILTELEYRYGYKKENLPSRSSVASYLEQEGLTLSYEPHSKLPITPRANPTHEHEQWQIDGRGNEEIDKVGTVAFLNIKDVFSSVYVACFPAKMKSKNGHPTMDHYQMAVRLGFLEFGLPKKIQTDHASAFYDNHSKSPFPTRFHLWLIALGIQLVYSRVHRPTDQAKVERAHEILFNQTVRSHQLKDWKHLFEVCQNRRKILNTELPSSACQEKPPLEAFPKAKHSGRIYTPQQEINLLNLDRVYQFLAQCTWFRRVSKTKSLTLAKQGYYLAHATPGEQLKITFCPTCKYFFFWNDKELLVDLKPIKGLSKAYLIGHLNQLFNTPNLQLPIPFDWEQVVSTTFLDFT